MCWAARSHQPPMLWIREVSILPLLHSFFFLSLSSALPPLPSPLSPSHTLFFLFSPCPLPPLLLLSLRCLNLVKSRNETSSFTSGCWTENRFTLGRLEEEAWHSLRTVRNGEDSYYIIEFSHLAFSIVDDDYMTDIFTKRKSLIKISAYGLFPHYVFP